MTMTRNIMKLNRSIVVLLALSMLTACATTGSSPEERVATRAQARWDMLLAKDIEGAYAHFSPGYRSSFTLLDYYRKLAAMRIKWTGAEVRESNCSGDSCKVRIYVDYIAIGAVPGVKEFRSGSFVNEDWVLSGDEWYLLPAK